MSERDQPELDVCHRHHFRSGSQQVPTICWEAHTTWATCPLLFAFLHGCWMRGNQRPGWAPIVLLRQDEECVSMCVCVCVWRRSERCLLLVCFELFHASCFDLLSHPFIPHTPCASGFWFAAHRRWGWRGMGGWGRGVTASHRDTACSVSTGRGAGRAAHGAQSPGAEGSGWRVHQELKWCILYSPLLFFYALLDLPTVGWNSCVKNNCHSA